jgi:hypothetical protein
MAVKMVAEILSPDVESRDEADLGTPIPRINRDDP